MNDTVPKKVAALPQHSAERLCLSVAHSNEIRREAAPRVLTLVLLLLTAHCSLLTAFASPWTRQPSGTMAWLQDVYFADKGVGWVIATRDILKLKTNEPASYLLKTEDGGMNWRPVVLSNSDLNTRLVRLVFADPQHGWAFGETGVVFGTSDGG